MSLSSATSAPLSPLTPCSPQGERRGRVLPCPALGVGGDSQELLEEALRHTGVETEPVLAAGTLCADGGQQALVHSQGSFHHLDHPDEH